MLTHERPPPFGASEPDADLAGVGSKYRGMKKALATSVGSTALPMTDAMSIEY
jgi:hypothetical protein